MYNYEEVELVKSVKGNAGSVDDVGHIHSVELGSVSSIGMVVDVVEQRQSVEEGSEVMSIDDDERVRIVEEALHMYSIVKGYDLVHGQVMDIKNYLRELNYFI
ncbi:hypothetical protein Tco_1270586 [Tanacetum coccineum]